MNNAIFSLKICYILNSFSLIPFTKWGYFPIIQVNNWNNKLVTYPDKSSNF